MTTEDFCPALASKVPAASIEDASARIGNLTGTSLEGLMGSVYSDAEQYRLAMNEAGYMTSYKLKKESASETSRIFIATTTCKDGSQWEMTLWEFGHLGSRLLTVIMAKEFVKKAVVDGDEFR